MSPPKSGILPNHEDLAGVATDYSYCSHGVLDSGATKTVIGSNLVEPLLQSFHPEVKSRVTRCTCDVTFRFGNLSTLEAKHALVIPVGYLNLRVASVQGNTPFLLSNTLMRALKAVLDSCLDMCLYKIIPYMAPFEQVWGLKWSNAISPKLLENSRCKGAHFWTCLYTETKVHCARGSFLDMSLH